MTWWAVIVVCKLAFSQCVVLQDVKEHFQSEMACDIVLRERMGKIAVNVPVGEKWRIVGYCGLPFSSMKALALNKNMRYATAVAWASRARDS